MAHWLALSFELRLLVLALAGLVGGCIANHCIYTYCYFPRPISPWAKPDPKAVPRTARDRVPVIGWLGLRRESPIHGDGFWVRPILIELGLMFCVPVLYWYETAMGGLFPPGMQAPAVIAGLQTELNSAAVAHIVLLFLMTAATFIDFDERTVPDWITIPGTILGVLLASIWPGIYMLGQFIGPVGGGGALLLPTLAQLPTAAMLDPKWFSTTGLVAGLVIWSVWCFALADRRLILRRGVSKAVQFFVAGLFRHSSWMLLAAIWAVGCFGTWYVWSCGGLAWNGMFTALVGLAVGGGIVWAIRIVASATMGLEAMGFGDVTLMAMIGAFLGWQASLAAFFLAPFAAIGIVVIVWVINRDPATPFGPYLCAGAAMTILFWDPLYNGWLSSALMMLGPQLFWMGSMLLVMLAVLLGISRGIKRLLGIG